MTLFTSVLPTVLKQKNMSTYPSQVYFLVISLIKGVNKIRLIPVANGTDERGVQVKMLSKSKQWFYSRCTFSIEIKHTSKNLIENIFFFYFGVLLGN